MWNVMLQLTSSDTGEHRLELPVLVYNEVLSSGWCDNVPMLIHSDQLAMIEKGLLAMRALCGTCGFSAASARLRALVRQFEGSDTSHSEAELNMEYINHLLEHCRALLKYIRSQNLDL